MPARRAQQEDENIPPPLHLVLSAKGGSDHLLPPSGEKACSNTKPSLRVSGERVVRKQTDRVRGELSTTRYQRHAHSGDFQGSSPWQRSCKAPVIQ